MSESHPVRSDALSWFIAAFMVFVKEILCFYSHNHNGFQFTFCMKVVDFIKSSFPVIKANLNERTHFEFFWQEV